MKDGLRARLELDDLRIKAKIKPAKGPDDAFDIAVSVEGDGEEKENLFAANLKTTVGKRDLVKTSRSLRRAIFGKHSRQTS